MSPIDNKISNLFYIDPNIHHIENPGPNYFRHLDAQNLNFRLEQINNVFQTIFKDELKNDLYKISLKPTITAGKKDTDEIDAVKRDLSCRFPNPRHPMRKLVMLKVGKKIHVFLPQSHDLTFKPSEGIKEHIPTLLRACYENFVERLNTSEALKEARQWSPFKTILEGEEFFLQLKYLDEDSNQKYLLYKASDFEDMEEMERKVQADCIRLSSLINFIRRARERFSGISIGCSGKTINIGYNELKQKIVLTYTKRGQGKSKSSSGVMLIERIEKVYKQLGLQSIIDGVNRSVGAKVIGKKGDFILNIEYKHQHFVINGHILKGVTDGDRIAEALVLWEREKTNNTKNIKRYFGEENILKEDIYPQEIGRFGIYIKDTGFEIRFRDFKLQNKSFFIHYRDPFPSLQCVKNQVKVHEIVKFYWDQNLAIIFMQPTERLVGDGFYIQHNETFDRFVINCQFNGELYPRFGSISATIENLSAVLSRALGEAKINRTHEITSDVRRTTQKVEKALAYLPEGQPELFLQMFQGLVFDKPDHPAYFDPKGLREGNSFYTPDKLVQTTVNFLNVINNNLGWEAAPANPEKRKAFYDNLKAYLSHIIVALKKEGIEPIVYKETVASLALAFKNCATRWAGELLLHYNHLTGTHAESLHGYLQAFADQLKMEVVNQMVAESGYPGTHAYIAMCQSLVNWSGIALPNMEGAIDYQDPHAQHALVGTSYANHEQIREGFMGKFQVVPYAQFVAAAVKTKIKNKDNHFIALLLETVRNKVTEDVEADPLVREALKPIEEQLQFKKKRILANKDLEQEERERLLQEAGEERRYKVKCLADVVLSREEYITFDDEGMPKELTFEGALMLIKYLGLVVKR